MKNIRRQAAARRLCLFTCVLVWAGLAQGASSQYSLMLQRSPADGGTVTPGIGMHQYDRAEQMTLSAVPSPGYKFVCWLGEVGDTANSSTTITVDSPKMVVAVFERVEEQALLTEEPPPAEGSGSGPLHRSRGESGSGGTSPASGGRVITNTPEDPIIIKPPEPPEVPEPATVLILAVGGLIMRAKRRK